MNLRPWKLWAPDGTRIFYSDFGTNAPGPTVLSDLAVVTLMGDRRTETLLATAARESNAEIAPKGPWLAYETTEAGEMAVYVRPFPDVSARQWRVSPAGGVSPLWSRDGSTLFYRNGQAIMAVSVRGEPGMVWSPYVRRSTSTSDASKMLIWSARPRLFEYGPAILTPRHRFHAARNARGSLSVSRTLVPAANGKPASIANGVTQKVVKGDVVIVPAGSAHWFATVDSPITYLEVRWLAPK